MSADYHDDSAFLQQALDPAQSVVVDACAGSGKTWLLVSRIVRLLLAGFAPSEILAITFTRKGAQEMRARLTDSLRLLATAPDDQVREFLRLRKIPETELPQAMARARGLFEICLSAQPGVTIDTFHGWFLQLLERAPFSARHATVPADFTLDERTSFLIDEAWDLFGALMQQAENNELAVSFRSLAAELGYGNLRQLLGRFLQKRAEWWAYTRDAPDAVEFALSKLREVLDVAPEGDPVAAIIDHPGFIQIMERLAAVPAGSSKNQEKFLLRLAAARAQSDARVRLAELHDCCHTQAGTPLKQLAAFFDKPGIALGPEFGEFCGHLDEAREALLEHDVYRLHQRALPCAVRLLDVLQQLKRGRQLIDFTDIEWSAYRLLADSEDAAFMHAKLDARYRHILLDEFQDTNPLQWQALRAWLDAYGADANRPTVFLVGDPKQSIYRFRRAEPRLFQVAADTLVNDYGAVRLATNRTRRCSHAIVEAVNAVFADSPDYPEFHRHISLVGGAPGYVEVFPFARHDQPAEPAGQAALAWRNPLAQALPEHEDQRRKLEAAALASRIREIVGRWEVPAGSSDSGKMRAARYSDVMILKRNRTQLAVYEHALRVQGIPFLTSRQGGLLHTLEADDLCALIEVLIAPFDDLRLAHALRSPIFGCTDEDLVCLAQMNVAEPDGSRSSWWRRLELLAQSASPALRRAQRLLASWRAAADTRPVHDLLDRIYHEGQVLARYRAASPGAMAGQVAANLERFLELALELDSGRYPSLPRFVAELGRMRQAPDQEAPDEGNEAVAADTAGMGMGTDTLDAVRIYTVHGAKGLEAPIVFVIDANGSERVESYDVLVDWAPDADAPRHFSLYTTGPARGRRRAPLFAVQAALAERERLNLLYVAATRAKRYLFVSGVEDARGGPPAGSAYQRIADAVSRLAADAGAGLAVGRVTMAQPDGATQALEPSSELAPPVPHAIAQAWGTRLEQTPQARSGSDLHSVLEHVTAGPALDADAARVRRLLGLPEAEFSHLWERAQRIVNAVPLARFFDPARYLRADNEIEIAAESGSGRIDRLVEFDDEVWILDYKTGELADRAAWSDQLAGYRSLLKPLFAGKKLRSAVVLSDATLEEFTDVGINQVC